MMAWISRCNAALPFGAGYLAAAPVGLRLYGLGERRRGRVDGLQLAVHPLEQHVTSLRGAVRVPADVALHARPRAVVQRADDRLVVDLAGLLRHRLDQLTHRVGLRRGRVDLERSPAVLL